MISGKEKGYDGFFSDPINFDTVEGILRSHSYNKQNRTNPSPGKVIESALWRRNDADRRVVDDFWLCKDQAYRHFIKSRAGVLADFACQLFLRRNFKRIAAEDFLGTEASMFRKLAGLREFLTDRCFETNVLRQLDTPIAYSERRFFVRSGADFFAREDGRRYYQKKEDRNILPRAIDVSRQDVIKRDLFDDESSD